MPLILSDPSYFDKARACMYGELCVFKPLGLVVKYMKFSITSRARVVHQIHDVAQVEGRAGHLHRVSVERDEQVLRRLRPLEGELARVNRTLITLIMRPDRRGSRTCRFVRVHPQ